MNGPLPQHTHRIAREDSARPGERPIGAWDLITSGSSEDEAPPREEAKEEIIEKLAAYGIMKETRDDLIRQADAHHVEEARIARLMGHSRTTIRHVLGRR